MLFTDSFNATALSTLIQQSQFDDFLLKISQGVTQFNSVTSHEKIFADRLLASPVLDNLLLAYVNKSAITCDFMPDPAKVMVLASNFYIYGGHSLWAEEILDIEIGLARKTSVLFTNIHGHENHQDSLAPRLEVAGVEVEHLTSPSLHGRYLAGVEAIKAFRPAVVFLFNHQYDPVAVAIALAVASICKVVFVHHADHSLSLGAACREFIHCDDYSDVYDYCRVIYGHDNHYLPVSVRDSGKCLKTNTHIQRTASCGTSYKYTQPYKYNYFGVIADLITRYKVKHYHIGFLPDDVLANVRDLIAQSGGDPNSFVYYPNTLSLWGFLLDHKIDLYLGSFPIGGVRAVIEAFGAGIPVLVHAPSDSSGMTELNVIAHDMPTWEELSDIDALFAQVDAQWLAWQSNRVRQQYERYYSSDVLKSFLTTLPEGVTHLPVPAQRRMLREKWPVRAIAFYLPQFHPIPENDAWWGKGFTEWTNTSRATPLFHGHYQPHQPGELGYYDLRLAETMSAQIDLARQYGLSGFCFHYYWFSGRKILDRPLNMLLGNAELDFPFCLCWANENWTKRWDGRDEDILIQQGDALAEAHQFAGDLLPYFSDARYICIQHRPVLLVYRLDVIKSLPSVISEWKKVWHAAGVDPYLINVESFVAPHPADSGFDAACEFFPHQLDRASCAISPETLNLEDGVSGEFIDYALISSQVLGQPRPGYKRFRGVMPSWDNTARRGRNGATVIVGSKPDLYQSWLTETLSRTMSEFEGDERIVFINAWNEWAEGCHLEPDLRYGRAWLEATRAAMMSINETDLVFQQQIVPYQQWLSARQIRPTEGKWIEARFELERAAMFTLVLDACAAEMSQLVASLESFARQQYEHVRLVVVSPLDAPEGLGDKLVWYQADGVPSVLMRELALAEPENWMAQLHAGDLISENALVLLALRLLDKPSTGLVYADEDLLDPNHGPVSPVFKADFSLDYLRSYPYMGRFLFVRGREYAALGGFDESLGSACYYDYALRYYENYGAESIYHLSEVMFHGTNVSFEEDTYARHAKVLWAHLQRQKIKAELVPGIYPGSFRVCYQHASKPKVSIIIPTKDKVELLSRCVESLLEKTAYPNYEILIVDNQSQDEGALAYLQGLCDLNSEQIRVLSYPHPFNYSAVNNVAAREANGEFLLLLNNDTAALQPDWLDEMMIHAQRDEVGVVGAKLVYSDGSIQHGGVVLGLKGASENVYSHFSAQSSGNQGSLQLVRNYSAVTGACLLIKKALYLDLGGLNEVNLPVSFNDVDLCLRVAERGLSVVWTPFAVLLHDESGTQVGEIHKQGQAYFQRFAAENDFIQRRWRERLANDPAYSPNFSMREKSCVLNPLLPLSWNPVDWKPVPKVICFPADLTGCGQYRIIQPANALFNHGLMSTIISSDIFQDTELARLNPDVIVHQRQIMDYQVEALARRRRNSQVFHIFELDDYLLNLPLRSLNRANMPKDLGKSLRKALTYCDRFVVSTEPLAEKFVGYHNNIIVAKNSLCPKVWAVDKPQRRKGNKPRVGWAGGVSHTGDLAVLSEVVKALADEVEWVFMCMKPPGAESYVHDFRPGVPIDQYPAALASLDLDLALVPLENNDFNECKSNLRLLEYGICGYPVIATDMAPYRCGLPVTLVKNRFKDWVDAIREHISDLDECARKGDALRDAVRQNWMLEGVNLQRWAQAWSPE